MLTKAMKIISVRTQGSLEFRIKVNGEGEPIAASSDPKALEEHLRHAIEEYGFDNVLLLESIPFHAKAQIDIRGET